ELMGKRFSSHSHLVSVAHYISNKVSGMIRPLQALILGLMGKNRGIVSGTICDCRQGHELSDHKTACLPI
ncbi:hypothetical protein, partial [Serratia quinivorans]